MIDVQATDTVSLTFELTAIESALTRVLADHESDGGVTVIISDDEHLHQLNERFRQIDRPTDVLSFELDDTEDPEDDVLGEIYISIDRARDQAREAGHPLEAEVRHLAVHGTLHLLGYEHDTDAGYEKMRSTEIRYVKTHLPHEPSITSREYTKGA